ncbi:O-antigen ligase family protein [Mobilitalea sibirica]|uniref:O-antigen ligase family protein n=1 Tax=Mobilitalea sibirica TaxID=1462919 RepID=A0A8J7H1J5_9FIRM|nr:O-antigen ligase family protein [Mobilitalea sibirica]MBH1940334.1 O-antigen ligase family protein [Mobilitalea sibirica]
MSNKTYRRDHKDKKRQMYQKKSGKVEVAQATNKWLLLPIVFIISILPFIVRMHEYETRLSEFPFFTVNNQYVDFFLYYKQWLFVSISFIMLLVIVIKAYVSKTSLAYSPIFIPLSVYAALSLLSSVLSRYRSFSFSGIHEHFESVLVILGYCLTVYYIYLIIETEQDVKFIINSFIISVIIMSVLGLTQYLGHDFLATELGLKLMLPRAYWGELDQIQFNIQANRVYLTLYNPNYVGIYAGLIAPILFILALLSKKIIMIPVYLLALVGVLVSLIGSQSKTGIIGLAVAGIFTFFVLLKHIIKYFYITIPLVILIITVVGIYNAKNNNILVNQIKIAAKFTKQEQPLTEIQTNPDEVVITYNKNQMHIRYNIVDGYGDFIILDQNYNEIKTTFDNEQLFFTVQDERFPGFQIGPANYNNVPSFFVNIRGYKWFFTNQTQDGTYYYINRYGKLDKIINAPSAIFTGYERYASSRGYIWSRTIPLLKEHILLGSGADTFAIAFPQQDYVNLYNYGFSQLFLTKPHNLYLQIGVQTGVLSLIAFLAFYIMYFLSSVRLYIKGFYKSYYAQVGVAILIGTISYMVIGFSNDSTITVAPIFWGLIGLGIAVNRKAKPLIEEEVFLAKAKKMEKNNNKNDSNMGSS